MAVCLALLLITGILFWQPWFGGVFPILLVRIAVVIHALSAVILVVGVIVHIYAAIWVKGTTEANDARHSFISLGQTKPSTLA